jgi:biotin synthase
MALTALPRRVALQALRASQCSSTRSFSTPVEDVFSPIRTTPLPSPPVASSALRDAVNARTPRYDWTKEEIREIYNTPLMELAFQAV